MRAAFRAEWLKLRRSTVTRTVSVAAIVAIPAMSFGVFWVAVNGGFGPLAVKADGLIQGEGWDGYLNAAGQITAAALFIAVGIAAAWVFGREHADRTFPALFSLAVTRGQIALAKFGVLLVWSAVVSVGMVTLTLAIGALAGVGAQPTSGIGAATVELLAIAVLSCLLAMTMGFVASLGRGYLPAIGALIAIVAVAQIAVLFGTGPWFPYTVPGLMAVAEADGVPPVGMGHIALVPLLLAISVWLTVRWWDSAEAV